MVKDKQYKEPVYTIGIVAKMLDVCHATLRIWERKSLIKPSRIGKNRFYSASDLDKLKYIKDLVQKKHINIEGAKKIIDSLMCWDIKKCSPQKRNSCQVYLKSKR